MGGDKRNAAILAFVLFVVMLGYGIITPILPFYIDTMGAGGTELGLLTASYAVMRLICGPLWGSLSERTGRKPILMLGILGYAITMAWFGLATRLWMLFAARILAGILSSATAPTTMAYIGDSTSEKDRGGGMGMLGAAGGIGAILGPALGGFLAEESLSAPFFVAAGLAVLSLLLAWRFLPESLPEVDRRQADARRDILGVRSWQQAVRGPLAILFVLTFISTCGLMVFANVFGLYAMDRFGFGPDAVGVMLMVLGMVSAVAQGVLAGPLGKRFGDTAIIRGGFLAAALAFVLMLLVDGYVTIMLATAFFGLAIALQSPALTALTSKRATVAQGVAMGLSNSFVSLGRIAGPLFGGLAFDVSPSLPYLGGSAIMGIGFFVSILALKARSAGAESLVGVSPSGEP